MALQRDIDALVNQATALHCADDPLELIPSDAPLRVATRSKLVGKLIRSRKLGRNVVKRILQRAWEHEHSWSLTEEKPNLFIFTFSNKVDRRYVRDQGIWTVDGSLFVIKEWPPELQFLEICFETVECCIKVLGLPICYFSKANTRNIGQRVGKTL
ncbi:hypothetical protein TorRG33x02_195540 [Trema orientale]|uniref:DUF4283 domain-containing protein n=1 Tax=Trema orientale TaxID=63057 RepID=A0A2P5EGE3_TREOI|nr:hypothetical protein TorRG33x02_195540 [Trema orientale]